MRTMHDFWEHLFSQTGFNAAHQFIQSRFECAAFARKLRDITQERCFPGKYDPHQVALTDEEWSVLAAELKALFPYPIMPKMRR